MAAGSFVGLWGFGPASPCGNRDAKEAGVDSVRDGESVFLLE